MLEQFLWSNILADYVSAYLGVLNGVDPAPVPLIEKLKGEVAKPYLLGETSKLFVIWLVRRWQRPVFSARREGKDFDVCVVNHL